MPSETLRLAITFRRPSDKRGPTSAEARLTTDLVSAYAPDPEDVGKALYQLQQRGFTVTARGRLTASVRCEREDFEKTFGTQLVRFTLASDATTRFSADSVLYPGEHAPWQPDPAISALIDEAYIQWPHIFMSEPSPLLLAPFVDYYHLRLPHEVAMLLQASKVHRAGTTGRGIRVAMIDSGFAHTHPFFQEMGYNSSVVLAPGATHREHDGVGHGTGESANLFAIAPDVTFIGVKLSNEDDPNLGASLLEGLQEALQHDPHVISISLGHDLCPRDPNTGLRTSDQHLTSLPNGLVALEAEIAAAVSAGVIVVFSAGNGQVAFPGMMPEVISAGGVYLDETGALRASDYASAFVSKIYPGRAVPDFCGLVGLQPHANYLMLPVPVGCEIDRNSAEHDGTTHDDGWAVFSGTSAAAPQIAGVCALLLQKNSGLSPSEVKNVLRRTCRDVDEGHANPASNEDRGGMPAGTGNDSATGAGLVDTYAAWLQV